MSFELVKLNYAYDALEPVIDKETMEIHHSKHHQAYVNNLNNLIKDTVFEEASLEEILTHLEHAPEEKKNGIRNNVGGVFNHNLFWESMIPGGSKEPVGEVAKKINEKSDITVTNNMSHFCFCFIFTSPSINKHNNIK